MKFVPPDQQPIRRIVGRRRNPPPGFPPSDEARTAMAAMADYRTRAPKGIFIYACHEDMQLDRERWTIEAVVTKELETPRAG